MCRLFVVFALLVAAPVLAQEPAVAHKDSPAAVQLLVPNSFAVGEWSVAEERVLAALDEETELDFIEVPLIDGMQFLANFHSIPIVVDQKSLEGAGISQDDAVLTMALSGVSLRSALRLILEPWQLTTVVEDDVLKVTTQNGVESRAKTIVYDVSRHTAAGMDSEMLATVVQTTVAPELWKTGNRIPDMEGTVAAVPNGLVVHQTVKVHQEIDAVLRKLLILAERPGKP